MPRVVISLLLALAAAAGCGGELETTRAGVPDAAVPTYLGPSRPVTIGRDEVIRRLSQMLFREPPAADLRANAAAADLSTSAAVARLALVMLHDGRAARGVEAFVQHWLDVDQLPLALKDPVLYPRFGPELARDMLEEIRRFVGQVILEGDGRLETLLTARFAFVNERLAQVYGFAGVQGPQLRRVEHDGLARVGVLGLPGIIAWRSREARTYPSRRGHYAGGRFACRPVFVSTIVDPMIGGRTMRAVQDEFTAQAGCQGCHHYMNPPGWAFEHFDAIGAYRTTDAGLPVDARGSLPPDLLDTPAEVPFDGLPDLARAIARSPRASLCHAFYWLTFGVPQLVPDGRVFEAGGRVDDPSAFAGLAEVVAAFRASGLDIRALIAAVASSPTFLAP
jgi:hypothetical protein